MVTAEQPATYWRPVRLRVEDFLLLNDSGAFEGLGKTELIEGEIEYMNAQHRRHAWVKKHVARRLEEALAVSHPLLAVLTEVTVSMPPASAPEPDIVVTSEPRGDGPVPLASVALIVEVSDSTFEKDRKRKAPLYATKGVPEYWLVDTQAEAVEIYSGATGGVYERMERVDFGQPVEAHTLSGIEVGTNDL